MQERGGIDIREAFIDGSFVPAKKGAMRSAGQSAAKGVGSWQLLLKRHGVEMIAPHRRNRKKPKTQDGRKLRRYKRRWKVERLFAWLQNFRRLVVRNERSPDKFLAFLLLACSIILLRFFEIGSCHHYLLNRYYSYLLFSSSRLNRLPDHQRYRRYSYNGPIAKHEEENNNAKSNIAATCMYLIMSPMERMPFSKKIHGISNTTNIIMF